MNVARFFHLPILLLMFAWTPDVWAKPYSELVQLYKQKQFVDCYTRASKIPRRGSRALRARYFLMAGVCADKLNRIATRQKMFKRSLKLNPQGVMPPFVRDKNIQLAFLDLKARYATNRANNQSSQAFRATDAVIYTPLGFNYFLEGYSLPAAVHGTVQTLAIAGIIDRLNRSVAIKKENKNAEKKAKETGSNELPEYLDYKASNKAYIKKMEEEGFIFLTIGILSYVFSVWDVGTSPSLANRTSLFQNSVQDKQAKQDLNQSIYIAKQSGVERRYSLGWQINYQF